MSLAGPEGAGHRGGETRRLGRCHTRPITRPCEDRAIGQDSWVCAGFGLFDKKRPQSSCIIKVANDQRHLLACGLVIHQSQLTMRRLELKLGWSPSFLSETIRGK